jgi:plastocyanin
VRNLAGAKRKLVLLLAGIACIPGVLFSETIDGTVVIRRKLTRPRVTAPVPLYQRGTVVRLGQDPVEDPLAMERARVVIWIEGAVTGSIRFPSGAPAKMEQLNRRFSEETLVISAGSSVSFPNLDPVFHNVFSLSKAKSFDLGNYPQGETRIVTFSQPGIVYVNCHLHPNMSAAIVVTPNQWNTRADRAGTFSLSDVPPGAYTLVAWHKSAGYFRQAIRLEAGSPGLKVEFLIPLDAEGNRLETRPGVKR